MSEKIFLSLFLSTYFIQYHAYFKNPNLDAYQSTHTLSGSVEYLLQAYNETSKPVIIHVMSLKEESGRFLFHFREIFEKCIKYIGKFLIHFREDLNFCLKSGTF